MSPSMLLELRAGFDERIAELGQRFRLDKTGQEWDAILLKVQPIDPQFELGSDWREMATLESRRDGTPAVAYGDYVIQVHPFWATDSTTTATWKVIRREDNPADFALKFWVVKVTDQDAQP